MTPTSILLAGLLFAQGEGPVHPSYQVAKLRPANLELAVGGMGWLSDGRLAVVHWGTNSHDGGAKPKGLGRLYVVMDAASGSAGFTTTLLADSLLQPLGLAVVDDTIYVLEKHEIKVYSDRLSPGTFRQLAHKTLKGWTYDPAIWGEWAHGLVHHEGWLYFTLGANFPDTDPNTFDWNRGQPKDRCSVVRIRRTTGELEVLGTGLRSPNGIGMGPDGDIYFTDNQGTWIPSDPLHLVRKGSFYGYELANPAGPYRTQVRRKPVAWFPHGEMAKSLTSPVLVPDGIFSGQLLVGDMTLGGIQRVFLDRVAGEPQGAVFRFSGGFEAGVNRLAYGPDGHLYVGGLGSKGECPGFCWNNRLHGLELMSLRSPASPVFEMLAVRSRRNGLEVEFTAPVSTTAGDPAKFAVSHWTYQPTQSYGGPKVDTRTATPKAVLLSPDRRKLFLEVEGLATGRVVNIKLIGVTAQTGAAPWQTDVWYTLNVISASNAFDVNGCMKPDYREYDSLATFDNGACRTLRNPVKLLHGKVGLALDGMGKVAWDRSLGLHVQVDARGRFSLTVRDILGRSVAAIPRIEADFANIPASRFESGLYVATLAGTKGKISMRFILP